MSEFISCVVSALCVPRESTARARAENQIQSYWFVGEGLTKYNPTMDFAVARFLGTVPSQVSHRVNNV